MSTLLSIVLPTYNERTNLPLIIQKLESLQLSCTYEIIVVDDNSPDGTWELARQLGESRPFLKVVHRVHARGLSSAVMDGFAVAQGKYFVVMDADLQHDESALNQFLEAFQSGAEIVVGSRKVAGGGVEDWSLIRRFVSFGATLVANFALSHTVTDPMSGFFGVRRELYEQLATKINPKGFKILLEFISRAKGAKVVEIGYIFRGRLHGESKLSTGVMFEFIEALYELSYGKWLPARFLKYLIVGLTGVICNQSALWVGKNFFMLPDTKALAVAIEFSIITNFILNNYWTFRKVRIRGTLPMIRGFLSFNTICLAGAIINYSVGVLLSTEVGLGLYGANLIGILLATFWNYMINSQITWTVPSFK